MRIDAGIVVLPIRFSSDGELEPKSCNSRPRIEPVGLENVASRRKSVAVWRVECW
jgi:hypothetical protein